MKKVIDGSLYNTDTAKKLGECSSNVGRNDFKWYEEELYRTKSGKYFLYGKGNAMSHYSERVGDNSWGSGSHIEPMSVVAAMKWAEESLTADEYSEIFGEPDEASDEREALNVSLPKDLKNKLGKMRSESGKSISKIIEEVLEEATIAKYLEMYNR